MREEFSKRFEELAQRGRTLGETEWEQWYSNALHLLHLVFPEESAHVTNLIRIYQSSYMSMSSSSSPQRYFYREKFRDALGVFKAAQEDFELGFTQDLTQRVFGEILGDFVAMAKASLMEGHKDVAAVLASAALEDALKRYAELNNLDTSDKSMSEVINSLKSQGLVSGPQKSLLETMPKIRNAALHANWDKLNAEDVSALIGFVEQFLLQKFSS